MTDGDGIPVWAEIWNERKKALDGRLTSLANTIQESEEFANLEENVEIIDSLKDFLDIFLSFFKEIETKQIQNGNELPEDDTTGLWLDKSTEEPAFHISTYSNRGYQPSYLFSALLEQASIDVSRLEAGIAQQKRDPSTINLAKRIWKRSSAVVPANQDQLELIDINSPIPYLTYRFEVRLLPYSNKPMIGVPYTAYVNLEKSDADFEVASADFMAVPHEVGHLIFRNGQLLGEDRSFKEILQETIDGQSASEKIPLWAMEWLEEIFADIYGCFIGNSLSIVGLHNMLANSAPNRVFVSSRNYPLPAVRPLILIEILRILRASDSGQAQQNIVEQQSKDEFETEMRTLTTAWTTTARDSWGIEDLNSHFFVVDGVPMRGKYIIKTVTRIAKAIIDTLTSFFQLPSRLGAPIQPNYKVGEAELRVSRSVEQSHVQHGMQLHPQHDIMVRSVREKSFERNIDEQETKFRWLDAELRRVQQRAAIQDRQITIDELADVILFSGWSDEGPKIGPGGGG